MNRELLAALCRVDGPSGREEAVRRMILQELEASPAPKEVTVDPMGNVLVHLIGRQPASKRLLLDAHMDEVGFLVSFIQPDGLLRFETVGGIDKTVLFGHRVRIGRQLGVIGGKAVHQCRDKEKETVPAAETMLIDIGAADRQAAEAVVSVGDDGTFAEGFTDWGNGFFCGKAVDDRVGCALLLTLAGQQPAYDVWLSFSVQEEVGLRGAAVVGNAVRPDIAVAVDATTAADTVGSTDADCVCRVRGGAVVSFADRATLYDRPLYDRIRAAAEARGIPTQTKTRVAGGNNAASLQRSHTGVQTAAVSLPCRYIHSPACVGHWEDVEAMEALLRCLVEELPA